MEEKFKLTNNKMFIGSIVGVLVLIILTIGATYAYFTFNADNQFGSQTIEATTEGVGSGVTLVKVGDGLRLDVSATEMLEESIGNKYYASGSEESATIGKISVVGEGKYNCTYTMNITKSATSEENDLYNKFQNMANKSEGQIYLNVNEEVYDFNTENLFPITYTETIRNITSEEYIKANLTIVNADIDQTVLNGADISITFEVTEFDCEYVNDETAPETFNLVLGGIESPEYTNTEEIEVYLEWEESDVESYCLTEESTSNNCTWTDVIQTRTLTYNTTTTYTLSSGEGEKTVYLYLKDSAYNISQYASDTIILDTTKPTISSVTKTSDEQTSISVSVTASDTNNIKTYYYSINNGSYVSSSSNTYTFSSLTAGTSYTISVYVIDNAGNQSTTNTQTFSTAEQLTASEGIIAQAPTGLDTSTAYGGMYRYIGTTADNYVSIGGVSYRIIGITSAANSTLGLETGQLKVIKTDSIGTYYWHTVMETDTTWEASAMYTYLNNTVLNNTSYIPSGWSNKIDSVKWYIGDVNTNTNSDAANNASAVLSYEDNTVTSGNSKIGLAYLSDHYYAYNSGGERNCYSVACSSWLTLSSPQWTMTRYGSDSAGEYCAWFVHLNGYVDYLVPDSPTAVRPTFYLTPDVQYVSGTGTSSDPFILQ